MNPFEQKPVDIEKIFQDWVNLYPKSYYKEETNPYTKTRIILMNGTEYEATFFSHQFSRHCNNNDIRREIALNRRSEQMQQKTISNLKPINETILESTIAYEQLAVDLTARLAQNEPDINVKNALDFALLEDFDHLYRYSDLLELEYNTRAEKLVGKYTEIMPGRPTIAHHRHPYDTILKFTDYSKADLKTKLHIGIITAAEQQTMNYYMNVGAFYTSEIGRKLYQEIALVEEEHVTHYGSLMDPNFTWLESLLLHEYTECYLYYSCFEDETDPYIKKIWEQFLEQEISHLHRAANLLQKYENKQWQQVIPDGNFPDKLSLGPNVDYVRNILQNTVSNTESKEAYVDVKNLDKSSDFFRYQNIVNGDTKTVPSHMVIQEYINKRDFDYRYEINPNPIEALRDRKNDNTSVGRE